MTKIRLIISVIASCMIFCLTACYDHAETFDITTESSSLPSDSFFEVHFIDVGQGDSSLIICDGQAMLIDGGSSERSSLIYSYLENNGIDHLKYIVATHQDEDHVGGLAGALKFASADLAYCNDTDPGASRSFNNFIKYLGDAMLSVPEPGTEITLGSAKGIILAPINNNEESNDNSLVIRMEYGSTSFIFTGDAQRMEETDLVNSGANIASTVLKVAHHGSSSSTSEDFLNKVDPQAAVISCGAANDYRHPSDQTLERLKNAGITLLRTDLQGNIICRSDGENITFEVEKNPEINTYLTFDEINPPPKNAQESELKGNTDSAEQFGYVLNKNSHMIHVLTCEAVAKMSESNKIYLYASSPDEVLAQYPDYHICHLCNAAY